MKTSYRERDYAYGLAMQKLRNEIGLTQGRLADRLGVSRRAVAEWEAGNSYPKTERLKELIALAVQQQAFTIGHETEEIRALWRMSRQGILLDEEWLSTLLDQRSSPHPQVEPLHGAVGTEPVPLLETSPLPTSTPPVPVEEAMSSSLVKSGSFDNDQSDKEGNDAEEHDVEAPHPSEPESVDENDHSQENCHYPMQTSSQTSADLPQRSAIVGAESAIPTTKTKKGWRNLLIRMVIILIILTIIGAAGILFFQAIEGTTARAPKNAYPSYLPGKGTLAFFDPLNQADGSQWSSDGTSCQFTGGTYHISQQLPYTRTRCYAKGVFNNFAFEVQLTITQGDCGGIDFRKDNNGHYYSFQICQNGRYQVQKRVDSSQTMTFLSGNSPAIHTKLNQQNKIAFVASGITMTFYVNGQQINHMQDSSYTSGSLALIAYTNYRNATVVAFSNARLWTQ